MSDDIFSQSVQYERLVQAIYAEILELEGDRTTAVEHNVDILGRSGVSHQIDVLWRFRKAGVEHLVIIECKNYAKAVNLEKIRNLFAVQFDIGKCQAIMVTKTGYQSGVKQYADYYDIDLKLVRVPTDEDWEGRVKDIETTIIVKNLVSTNDKPVLLTFELGVKDQAQGQRIERMKEQNRFSYTGNPAEMMLYTSSGDEIAQLGWWIPNQLDILSHEPGGPYIEKIQTQNVWIRLNEGSDDEEMLPLISVTATYFVENFDERKFRILGKEIVQAILKDSKSGEIEHIKRRDYPLHPGGFNESDLLPDDEEETKEI